MPANPPPPPGPAPDTPVVLDLTKPTPDLGPVRIQLESLAAELRRMWSTALDEGDFTTIDQLVEASQSVHRAAVALAGDSIAMVPSSAG